MNKQFFSLSNKNEKEEKASESIFFLFFFASRSVAMVLVNKKKHRLLKSRFGEHRRKKRFCGCLGH